MVVVNSSPLIYLTRIGKLGKLIDLFKRITIAESVFAEVVDKGEKLSRPEPIQIRGLMRQNKILVKRADKNKVVEAVARGIHEGEAESLILAKSSGDALVVDDKSAYTYATILGVRGMRTMAVMMLMLKEKVISLTDYRDNLRKLSSSGFWLTADVHEKAIEEGEKIARQ